MRGKRELIKQRKKICAREEVFDFFIISEGIGCTWNIVCENVF